MSEPSEPTAPPADPARPPTIGLNDFARRHTPESRFSHFAGSESDLLALASQCLRHARPGNRDGIVLVPVPIAGFYSAVVVATDRMGLDAQWVRRAEGEDPYIEVTAPDAPKTPATAVTLVAYRRDLLAPSGRASTDCDWEVVSINARADRAGLGGGAAEEPQHPLSMARNHLGRPGGTPVTYSPAEYAKSILYWGRRVHVGVDPDRIVLTGPEFPPLTGAVLKRDRCPDWVEAVCADWTFLPPPARPEPPRPVTLAFRLNRLAPGAAPDKGEEWAKSILYWSARPRRETDGHDDI